MSFDRDVFVRDILQRLNMLSDKMVSHLALPMNYLIYRAYIETTLFLVNVPQYSKITSKTYIIDTWPGTKE